MSGYAGSADSGCPTDDLSQSPAQIQLAIGASSPQKDTTASSRSDRLSMDGSDGGACINWNVATNGVTTKTRGNTELEGCTKKQQLEKRKKEQWAERVGGASTELHGNAGHGDAAEERPPEEHFCVCCTHECAICAELRLICFVTMPCLHMGMCEQCLRRIFQMPTHERLCPFCQQRIRRIGKLHFV